MVPFLFLTTLSLLGYHLTFDAEMSTPSDMSQFINTFANGDTTLYNNHESENYVPYGSAGPAAGGYPNPYNFENGALTFTASPVPTNGLPYTSGMIETASIFTQSSGYFEIRATTPSAKGFWPAFWLLPAAYYPEIDILEQPNNSGTDTEYWTHTSTPTNSTGGFNNVGATVTQGYHRYGFLWTGTYIQYVFDGTLIGSPHQVPPSLVGLQMYMIANLAVGSSQDWPGPPAPGSLSTYAIDYVRAYSNDPTTPAIGQQPISSPDGADTSMKLVPPTPPVPPTIGSGLDSLVLQISEDAFRGDAQFIVTIDGHQVGGTQTAVALHAMGQSQAFTIKGSFGTARHVVTVRFLNDAYALTGDRNLYVTSATLNAIQIRDASLVELVAGGRSFAFSGKLVPTVTIGAGPDSFLFGISENAFTANAHYTIMVDGVPQGNAQVASAVHSLGQSQAVSVLGNFGPGTHTFGVVFSNGAAVGSATDPANLYIDDVAINGCPVANSQAAMLHAGQINLTVPALQDDNLLLAMTEDAFQGDAQAVISIDGVALGTTTVSAIASPAIPQALHYAGNWGGSAISHVITVDYVNDAYAAPGQDRNLHVQSLSFDGVPVLARPYNMMVGGPVSFTVMPVAPPGWSPGN